MKHNMNMNTLVVLVVCLVQATAAKVLLISMDGFRWDYTKNVATPNFDAFAGKGTRARYVNNTFITKTFPCHYTIATGLYEESHGIIANHMYDPVFNETFGMGTKDTKWWDGGEPIWVTVRKHRLNSAVYFWPGSETEIHGMRPNIWYPYKESTPFKDRVDTVVGWFTNNTANIDLALLYFHEPDHTGHQYGPDSPEVRDKVAEMDSLLGYIVKKLQDNGLFDTVNVIVTSDHGMTEIDLQNRLIDLSNVVDTSAILRIPGMGSVAEIQAVEGREDELVANLSRIAHMTTYLKQNIPDHWHYKNNRRIMPILCVADEGWMIVKNGTGRSTAGKGTHGYDNGLLSMRPIFYARGPNIKQNYTIGSINSVDIYPLIAELLGIRPAANNGTLDNTKGFIMTDISGAAPAEGHLKLMVVAFVSFLLACM